MDKKRTCHSKKPDDPPTKPSETDKSVTGIYYGKISQLVSKKKIKCIYEPQNDYRESTGSLVESESNLASRIPVEVKIFSNEGVSPNRSFFNQEDLSKGCIKPSSASGNSENLGMAIGVQIPAQGNSKDLTVVVEFDVVGQSSTSLTELKQYTSRMKLSEETPSKMIFNGIMKLQPRDEPFQITDIPLYIIDPKEKIVENPGFNVSYRTSAKTGNKLVVDKLTDVLVKLKVDKPSGKGGGGSSGTKQNKACCCNTEKKVTVSDILMCRSNKSKGLRKSASSISKDQKTETNATIDATTQSNPNIQASKSNQTSSQTSVSSGKDFESKSNQTAASNPKNSVSIKDSNVQSVHKVEVVENAMFKPDVRPNPSGTEKNEPTKTESKHQQKRREGWDRLEKKRSREDSKLTNQNPNWALRNAATQSSINNTTANKEISVQYSFIQPSYGIFSNNNFAGSSSSTLTDSLVPVKSAPFVQMCPKSIESTSTQWPQSILSTNDRSGTLTLVSEEFDSEKQESKPEVKPSSSHDGTYPFSPLNQHVMNVNFSTQTDLFPKPDMTNTYSQYMSYPVEDDFNLNLDKDNDNITEHHDTLDLLKMAKFRLKNYAENPNYSYSTNPFIDDVDSILSSEEIQKDESLPKSIHKEIDASQRAKRQNIFTRFINHLKPTEVPVSITQYHTICSTSTPFQLKPIPSLHDLQNEVNSNSFDSAKFEMELQTVEIENVNNKLGEEIDSLKKIYDDLYTNMSFIFENKDIFPIPPDVIQTKDTEKRSIQNINSDISKTFIELQGCLSTIDKILSTASMQSIYRTPPSTASSSNEDIVAQTSSPPKNMLSHEIYTTYANVENDIKKTITELLKESEYIKHQALLNGAPEEPEPPFIFEYMDFLKEANPLLICKSIVDDLSNKSSNTTQQAQKEEKDEKLKKDNIKGNCGKKSIGSCSRIKTDAEGSNKKDIKLKVDNKKNDRITYFCTTFVSKVPKTSFSFGGNSRVLHREPKRVQRKENVSDNTTSGDNVTIHEGSNKDFCKTCSMEPNLTTKNLISINEKSEFAHFDPKDDIDTQNYEKNLSYSNYIAYLNATNSTDDSKIFEEVPKEPRLSSLVQQALNVSKVNVLQMQKSSLTNDSSNFENEYSDDIGLTDDEDMKPNDHQKNIPSRPGVFLKSPKSCSLAENFNRGNNNLPSTSTAVYKNTDTTDDEIVIREIDLTKENRETPEVISDEPLDVKKHQPKKLPPEPHQQKQHSHGRYLSTTSSDECVVKKNPPKHAKRSKEIQIVALKPETIMDSDSDETMLKTMQQHCKQEYTPIFPESSYNFLKATRANTNVSMQSSDKPMLTQSYSEMTSNEDSASSFGRELIEGLDESDYDADTDQIITCLPVRVYKSKQEMNSPEEMERIEENVRQNDMLERRNMRLLRQPTTSESIYDDYLPKVTKAPLSDYSLSDSSPEMYSSDHNG